MDPVTGSIVASLGSSLIGGLFGGKNKSRTDLRRMVIDAERAGFNPLTVLQATGGAGWTSQASASDFDVGLQAAGAVMQGLGDHWANQQQRELNEAKIDLARAQAQSVRQASGPTQAGPFGASVQSLPSNAGRIAPSVYGPVTSPTAITVTELGPAAGDPIVNMGHEALNRVGDWSQWVKSPDGRWEPAEMETQGYGAWEQGRFPEWFGDGLQLNYPRTHEALSTIWQGSQDLYDHASNRENWRIGRRVTSPDELSEIRKNRWFGLGDWLSVGPAN